MKSSALNTFDGILYINLSKRIDRKKAILNELKRVGVKAEKIYRIEGELDELNGSRGCVKSHRNALAFALEKNWKNVLILEDDCMFIADSLEIDAYVQNFFLHFKKNWDVLFLGTHPKFTQKTEHEDYLRVQYSMRAHAYAVNDHYLEKLKDHYDSTYESLKNDLFFTSSLHKALDRRWVDLQLVDRWYVGKNRIAFQRESYSDIEKEVKSQR